MKTGFETLTVNNKEYPLRLTSLHVAELEKAENKGILDILADISMIKYLSLLYLCAAKPFSDDIRKIEDVYQLFDDYIIEGGNFNQLQEKMIDVYTSSGLIAPETSDMIKKAYAVQGTEVAEALDNILNIHM